MPLTPPWRDHLTAGQLAEIDRLADRPPAAAIRVNTLRLDPDSARQSWADRYGWRLDPVPYCPAGLVFEERPSALGRTLEHRMGFFYIQDMASMLPAEMFTWPSVLGTRNPELPLLLDMAAAPGGKTTHLIDKTADRGLIVANDISDGRAGALLSNLRRWGATSAAVTKLPGERLGRWLPEAFDAVLLDAPCSGENLRNEGGSKQRRVSARERRALHDRQVRLLHSAFGAARPGGEVVYATCTVDPDEDEAVLDDFLRAAGPAAEVTRPPALADLPGGLPGDIDPRVASAVRLWPYLFDTGSFFAALIRKRESLPGKTEPIPGSGSRRGRFEPLSSPERAALAAALRAAYGFELAALLDDRRLDLWRSGRFIHAIPRLLDAHFAALPVKAAGMLVGEDTPDGVIPSHELVSRFFASFPSGRLTLPDEHLDAWLTRSEIAGFAAPETPTGRVALLAGSDGRFLGRGQISAGRLRALFPAGF